MDIATIAALIVAGLTALIFAVLWLLDTFGAFDREPIIRRLFRAAGLLMVAVVLMVPKAFQDGVQWFAEWRAEREIEQFNDWWEHVRPATKAPRSATDD